MYFDVVVKTTFLFPASLPYLYFRALVNWHYLWTKMNVKGYPYFIRDHVALCKNIFWAIFIKMSFFCKKKKKSGIIHVLSDYISYVQSFYYHKYDTWFFFTFCISWNRIIYYFLCSEALKFLHIFQMRLKKSTYVHSQPESITTFEEYFKLLIYITRDFRIFNSYQIC